MGVALRLLHWTAGFQPAKAGSGLEARGPSALFTDNLFVGRTPALALTNRPVAVIPSELDFTRQST